VIWAVAILAYVGILATVAIILTRRNRAYFRAWHEHFRREYEEDPPRLALGSSPPKPPARPPRAR